LFNENGDGSMELLNGDKFTTLCSPNVQNLVAFFKHQPCNVGYVYSIFAFKAIVVTITFKIVVFQDNSLENYLFGSRCLCMEMVVNVIW